MSESKFTKGEWCTYHNGVGCDGFAIVVTPIGKLIPPEEEKANANLIAAAPEMYEMLMHLVSQDCINDVSLDTEVHNLLAKVRGE